MGHRLIDTPYSLVVCVCGGGGGGGALGKFPHQGLRVHAKSE